MSDSVSSITIHRGGYQPLSTWVKELGLPDDFCSRNGSQDEEKFLEAKRWLSEDKPSGQNFWPALILAYIAQAEEVLRDLKKSSIAKIFASRKVRQETTKVTKNGPKAVNTLNFLVGTRKYTLRPKYNNAANVIRINMRREHPSAAPHATQAWKEYRKLIELIFAMPPESRTSLAEHIWDQGVIQAPERKWTDRAERIVRPFEKVLADFDTSSSRGGALFQGLVFGYFRADSPNLTLESHSVNTGSSRADMPGDVAGFRGEEVELAVEVKDHLITADIIEEVLSEFLEDLVNAPNATAVVVADKIDQESRERLSQSNVVALSREELRSRTMTWDLPKQQEALRGALYYLGRIQKKSELVKKLTDFLTENQISGGIIDQPTLKESSASV